VNTRIATSADIPFMMALERECAIAAHWGEDQYRQLFQAGAQAPERLVLVAELAPLVLPPLVPPQEMAGGMAGFLVARVVAHEWELENIVVAPGARRRGIGRQLLEALLTTARKTEDVSVFLEVRESNLAARRLYEKSGFRQTGRRAAYYPATTHANPSEDAILYHIALT
jgi:ribosomal-protein-alanine acetyltransferase